MHPAKASRVCGVNTLQLAGLAWINLFVRRLCEVDLHSATTPSTTTTTNTTMTTTSIKCMKLSCTQNFAK